MSSTASTGRDPLVVISLISGVGFTAIAEFHLAITIGAPWPVAVLLPLSLDVYVFAAIRRSRGRDIALSLVLMSVAQVAAHILEAGVVVVSVPLVAAVSLLVPLVIWRVHALAVPTVVTKAEPPAKPEQVSVVERAPEPAEVFEPEPEHAHEPELAAAVSRPELTAVPEPPTEAERNHAPEPVRQARRNQSPEPAPPTGRNQTRNQNSNAKAFDKHVSQARRWLNSNPDLNGAEIGKKLGTSDRYGRKVRTAALAQAS